LDWVGGAYLALDLQYEWVLALSICLVAFGFYLYVIVKRQIKIETLAKPISIRLRWHRAYHSCNVTTL
jgi:hypothetical protein